MTNRLLAYHPALDSFPLYDFPLQQYVGGGIPLVDPRSFLWTRRFPNIGDLPADGYIPAAYPLRLFAGQRGSWEDGSGMGFPCSQFNPATVRGYTAPIDLQLPYGPEGYGLGARSIYSLHDRTNAHGGLYPVYMLEPGSVGRDYRGDPLPSIQELGLPYGARTSEMVSDYSRAWAAQGYGSGEMSRL